MAKLEVLSNTRWRQPMKDRAADMCLFGIPGQIWDHCNIQYGTKRRIRVMLEDGVSLQQSIFTITSGKEMRMDVESQRILRSYKERRPEGYYEVEIIDIV